MPEAESIIPNQAEQKHPDQATHNAKAEANQFNRHRYSPEKRVFSISSISPFSRHAPQ
jgi:hypothetical protein